MDAAALLLEIYDQAFRGRSWHGTPLGGSLRGVTAEQALWRPGPERHNIWEIALHAAYWKCIVRRRLLRDPEVRFPRRGANWPALPEPADDAAWRRDRSLLQREHRLLGEVVASLDAADLSRAVPRSKWRVAQQVYGVASHDLYHAGQIQLLKRLSRSNAYASR